MQDEISVWDNEGGFNREFPKKNKGTIELEKLIEVFENMTLEEYKALHEKASPK